jgi:proteic killer suppression protein
MTAPPWRETDAEETDRKTVITNLMGGQYSNPVRIVAFNTAERWSRDVSEDVADEIARAYTLADEDIPASLADLQSVARRKLRMVDAAAKFDDLKIPPGNKLHGLDKDRKGQHAIWINAQFRVCFEWLEQGPTNVEITDYHDD